MLHWNQYACQKRYRKYRPWCLSLFRSTVSAVRDFWLLNKNTEQLKKSKSGFTTRGEWATEIRVSASCDVWSLVMGIGDICPVIFLFSTGWSTDNWYDNMKEILLQNLQTDFGDSKYLEKVDMNDSDKMMPWLDIVDFLFIAKIFCPKLS